MLASGDGGPDSEKGDRMPQVIAATFGDADAARKGLATIAGALGAGLTQGAVVQKAADGKITFVETKDMSTAQGAKIGGLAGAVLGIIAGPVGVIGAGALGAAAGSLAAKLRDSGFPDDQLKGLGDDLSEGQGAIVALVADDSVAKAQQLLKDVDAQRVVVNDVSTDLADLLDKEATAVTSA
jgi:uncharacterized membrane protein